MTRRVFRSIVSLTAWTIAALTPLPVAAQDEIRGQIS
jgi:hypothetical protein